jgi:hypothetical protein
MEHAKAEVEAVEQAVSTANDQDAKLLNELHLALIGGGIGDVVWA